MNEEFYQALVNKRKVKLTFYSKEGSGCLVRICAPMDYGPSRVSRSEVSKYHFWDYTSDAGAHPLSILEENIRSIEVLDESFDPSEFITWDMTLRPWFVKRDWGNYS